MQRHKFELYNTETEQVETVEEMTSQEANRRNDEFWREGEPRRWMVVRASEEDNTPLAKLIVQRPQVPIQPDGDILWI